MVSRRLCFPKKSKGETVSVHVSVSPPNTASAPPSYSLLSSGPMGGGGAHQGRSHLAGHLSGINLSGDGNHDAINRTMPLLTSWHSRQWDVSQPRDVGDGRVEEERASSWDVVAPVTRFDPSLSSSLVHSAGNEERQQRMLETLLRVQTEYEPPMLRSQSFPSMRSPGGGFGDLCLWNDVASVGTCRSPTRGGSMDGKLAKC